MSSVSSIQMTEMQIFQTLNKNRASNKNNAKFLLWNGKFKLQSLTDWGMFKTPKHIYINWILYSGTKTIVTTVAVHGKSYSCLATIAYWETHFCGCVLNRRWNLRVETTSTLWHLTAFLEFSFCAMFYSGSTHSTNLSE